MCESFSLPAMDNSPDIKDQKCNQLRLSPTSSSRILYHIPCMVCRDHSSGKHYGIYACDGCAGFFKRSIRRSRQYVCKSQKKGCCIVDKTHRNQCRSCRLQKCFDVGMNQDAVQHERGPRNSTLRRHMALYKEAVLGTANDYTPLTTEFMLSAAGLTGFPGVQALPMANTNIPPNPTMNAAFQTPMNAMNGAFKTPAVLDLSVPRVRHQQNMYQRHPALFTPTVAYLNSLALRVLPPSPPLVDAEHIKETAAEHLFKNINWIKNVPSFQMLPMCDQVYLLEESWKEFFILAMSQYSMPINFSQLLFIYEAEQPNRHISDTVTREVQSFQNVLNQLGHMHIDNNEYECLRAMSLFRKPSTTGRKDFANTSFTSDGSPNSNSSGESRGLLESTKVIALHDEARSALITYIARRHPHQPLRFQTILGVMLLMNKVTDFTIEELFFRKTIGDVTIVRLISDIFTQRQT